MPENSMGSMRGTKQSIAIVCVQCRCVVTDDNSASCHHCASDERITLQRDIYSDARAITTPALYNRGESWSVILLMVALGLMIIAGSSGSYALTLATSLMLLASSGMLAWGFPALRQRQRLRLIMRARRRALPSARWHPNPDEAADTVEIRGVARRLRADAIGPLSSGSCLLAAVDLVVRDKLAAREIHAVDFLVVDSDDRPHLVAGAVWLEECPPETTRPADEVELQIGDIKLPCAIVQGGTINETCIRDGDAIVVRGKLVREAHRDMARSYRDPTIQVLRGEAGRPVVISKLQGSSSLAVY